VDRSLLPADIREASKGDQQRYAAALSFEQLLTQQLTSKLTETAQSSDSDDDAADDATTNAYQQMLPETMAQVLTEAGGLGLARQLYDGMKETGA
jgi:Rod binding domain-containing protein